MIDVTKTPLEEIFSYDTKQSELNEVCKFITSTFIKPKYSSIPKVYYPFLLKLLNYKKFDYRGKYKKEEIKTFFVGKEMGNNAIKFFDIYGHCDNLGINSALIQFQNEKNIQWEHELNIVIGVLRNIAKVKIDKIRTNIVLPIKSEISGELINDIKDIHIDHHDLDFSELAYNWLRMIKKEREKRFGLDDTIHVLYGLIDNDRKYFKKETKLSKSFYDYHNSHTHLRIVTKKENLSKTKKIMPWEYLKINGHYIEKYAKESNK